MFSHRLSARLKQFSLLRITLLSTTLFDELVAGLPVIGIPLIRDQLHLSYTQVGILLSIGAFTALLLEPIANLLSDRTPKRYWIIGSYLILSMCFVIAGAATNFLALLLAFALIEPAGSIALGQSQAILIDFNPFESTRTMTRWTLMSSIGDLLAPLTITAFVSIHLGWMALCWLAASIWLSIALIMGVQRFPKPTHFAVEENEPAISLFVGLREALCNPTLLRWATLSLIPDMVDEVFLGFATLYLQDVLHANTIVIGVLITIMMLGGLLSLAVLDRFLLQRATPQRLLAWSALITLLGLVGFLTASSLWIAGCALLAISSGAACWYPIAKGQAYATLPGHSGTVRAVQDILGIPLVVLPTVVGLIAGHFGILAALMFLGTAPVFMLLLLIGSHQIVAHSQK